MYFYVVTANNPKLTASIVVFNTDSHIFNRCVECALQSPVDHLYIVDHSIDGMYRAALPDLARVSYIREENVGYGAGNNKAMRLASEEGATYHLVLNPDVYWADGVIEELIHYMEQNIDVGHIMPQVLYPDGSMQYQAKLLPSPADMIAKRFSAGGIFRNRVDRHELRSCPFHKPLNVPFLSGCFMMLRMEALRKIGFFDERFFLYCEDIDLTRRMHEHYRTVFYPFVTVNHELARQSSRNREMLWVHIKSAVKYFNKWGWLIDKQRKKFNRQLIEEIKNN